MRPVLESERIEKVGHNLKLDLSVLKWHGVDVRGKLFDTMVAHSLVEPEMRHNLSYIAEVYLSYTPLVLEKLASPGHATPVRRLWQIGASTHPGPGLGAGSGTLVAKRLLEPPLLQRMKRRAGR